MVKLFFSVLISGSLIAGNSFEKNCIPCHKERGVSLRDTFMQALLVYSGEKNMKAGLKYFLRHPSTETSVMGRLFLKSYPLKKASELDDTALDDALNTYWERYKIIGNLH